MSIHPCPKPTKGDRPKHPTDTTGLRFEKAHPVRDMHYRIYIRDHPCTLFAAAECKGRVVCAHLTPPGQASRGQKFTDISCVPLCDFHHDLIDRRVYVTEETRNEMLVFCWSRALALREAWWRHLVEGGDATR